MPCTKSELRTLQSIVKAKRDADERLEKLQKKIRARILDEAWANRNQTRWLHLESFGLELDEAITEENRMKLEDLAWEADQWHLAWS